MNLLHQKVDFGEKTNTLNLNGKEQHPLPGKKAFPLHSVMLAVCVGASAADHDEASGSLFTYKC